MPQGAISGEPRSIETRASWLVAWSVLAILSTAYGAPLVVVVALKPIAAYALAAGSTLEPAIIEERESTAVIGEGTRLRVDAFGTLVVDLLR